MDLNNKTCFGYVRVSTDNQDLQRQQKQIRDFCEVHNITLFRIYSEKISGAAEVEEREQFSLLLKKSGEDANLVIISEMSRYSRQDDLVGVVYSISQLLKRGLGLIFLDDESKVYEPYSNLSMEDSILLIAKAFANAEERKKIVGRMTQRKLQLIRDYPNVCLGKGVPFGFKYVSNPNYIPNKHNGQPKSFIDINEDEAQIVREMFQMCADGMTLKEIQKYFVQHYNRPFENNKRRQSKYGDDTERKSISVSNILSNTIYYGQRNYSYVDDNKKEHKKWQLPPELCIIDKELWDKAKQVRQDHYKTFDKSKMHVNPLKGIIKCTCGDSMVVSNIRGHKVYTCYRSKLASKIDAKKWCGNYGISQELLMNIIINDVKNGLNPDSNKMKYDEATDLKLQEIRNDLISKQSEYDRISSGIIHNKRLISNYIAAIGETDDETLRIQFLKLLSSIEEETKRLDSSTKILDDEISSLKEYERSILSDKRIMPINDPNSDEYSDFLKSIISEIIYKGYDVLNGLVTIIYKNGFKAYYAVKKAYYSRKLKQRICAKIFPISSDYIQFDESQRVILSIDYNMKHEVQTIQELYDLVRTGHTGMLSEDKLKVFKPRYIINDNN